ncbi:MAG: nucleotidyltransferase family protein [Gemmatimonadaceae bacterium]
MRQSAAVYDVMAAAICGISPRKVRLCCAFEAPHNVWQRALAIEGCGPQLDRAFRLAGLEEELPVLLRDTLRQATSNAVQAALRVHPQVSELAMLASGLGIRVMLLKGAARLLSGEFPGARSVADIDVLVARTDAKALFSALREKLDYQPNPDSPAYHLPSLSRHDSLPIELHLRLSERGSSLDSAMWLDPRELETGKGVVHLPSVTNMVLHTLEHAVVGHWATRYRLRDVADVAAIWAGDVNEDAVNKFVRESVRSSEMQTLLSAARYIQPAIPVGHRAGWRTVSRVGRTRLAAAVAIANPRRAGRAVSIASVLAELRPSALGQLARVAWRRYGTASIALCASALSGCAEGTRSEPPIVPAFVYVSDESGHAELYRFRNDSTVRLTFGGVDNLDPHVIAGRLAFTSFRDGNAEVYLADSEALIQKRLTQSSSYDGEPSLDPGAQRIAFVSNRGGVPRIWLVDSTGLSAAALQTGSSDAIPERSPAWSPSGDRIAFTSTRTGTSQVYVVASGGGLATQVTHESGGAFTPDWMGDGNALLYVTDIGTPSVRKIVVASGVTSDYASHSLGVGDPSCTNKSCVVVEDPFGTSGRIVALSTRGGSPFPLLTRSARERQPAVIR